MVIKKTCVKCGKSMDQDTQFYTYQNGEKTEMCKKCLTMHIDNFNPDTFLWLLEKMDVPYVPEEWNTLRDRAFAKNPNLTGMSVFGKYLSKMKLKQYKDYRWADSEKIQALNKEKKEVQEREQRTIDEEVKKQFENGEITEAEYKTLASTPSQNQQLLYATPSAPEPGGNPFADASAFMSEADLEPVELDEEEKIYLAQKWGLLYKPMEWVELESKYDEMMNSFDIQDADTKNTLVLLCKTNLKMNQAIDMGDVEGYQKLSKVSESLRKSAKFTAAQNKETKEDFVDCIGNMVAYCEKNGGQIPKYEIKTNYDIVDKVIKDLKEYTKSLIYEDVSLAQQIEEYLKNRKITEQKRRDKEEAQSKGRDVVEITDQDISDYRKSIEEDRKKDLEREKADYEA